MILYFHVFVWLSRTNGENRAKKTEQVYSPLYVSFTVYHELALEDS